MRISVIIPTLNEARLVSSAVDDAWRSGADEVVVVDGGSEDSTAQIARDLDCTLLTGSAGRGRQLNAGARVASGDTLLFLHADTRLVVGGCDQIRKALLKGAVCGAFHQKIDNPRWIYRLIESGNACRVRCLALPYGDQGIFVRREVFDRTGGFDNVPLMEDLLLAQKLRRHYRFRLLPGPLKVSARRWERQGPIRQTLRNWSILWSALRGTDLSELARRYHDG